jgi:hypothetical protein
MATQNGTNYAKSANPSQSNRNDPGTVGGRLRSLTDNFTFAGEAAGEVINIGKDLVAGAVVHKIIIDNAALGASVTLDVGDSDDPNRYVSAYDANGNTHSEVTLIAGVHYVIGTNSGDETIIVTTAGAAATGLLKVTIVYSED